MPETEAEARQGMALVLDFMGYTSVSYDELYEGWRGIHPAARPSERGYGPYAQRIAFYPRTDARDAIQLAVTIYERLDYSFRVSFAQKEQVGCHFYMGKPGDAIFTDAHDPQFWDIGSDVPRAIYRAALTVLHYWKGEDGG